MKSLILLRHAEAQPAAAHEDFERELTPSGEIDANHIGQRIFAGEIRPTLIIASPARRTRQTAKIVASCLQYSLSDIQFEQRLYDNTLPQALDVIREVDDSVQELLIVSHNPTITNLLHTLCGPSTLHIGTSCVAGMVLTIQHWSETEENAGFCQLFCTPR